jgi:hypothetical protein
MHLYAYKSVAMSMMSEIGSITNNSQSILIESILPTMMAFPSISKTIIYTKEKVLSTKEKLKNYFEINHEEFNILYYEIEEYNEKMYHLITLSKNISKESMEKLKRKVYLNFGFFIQLRIMLEVDREKWLAYTVEKVLVYPTNIISFSQGGGITLEEMEEIKSVFKIEEPCDFENLFLCYYSNRAVDSNPDAQRKYFGLRRRSDNK